MSALVAAGVIAVGVSLALRERARDPTMPRSEAIVIAGALTLASVGLAATGLSLVGWFSGPAIAAVCVFFSIATWPWSQLPLPKTFLSLRPATWVVPLIIVIGGLALRMPPNDYPLAGRDQGTYTLRAEQIVRTGRLDDIDRVLADLGADSAAAVRSGPADVVGLYAKVRQPWRDGRYEAAYRPGWYLADRARGRVTPQFLHLHPAVLAVSLEATGTVMSAVLLESGLALLALFCVARRLWNSWAWAGVAAAMFAVHPLAIWVGRTALSEGPTLLLLGAAFLCILRAGPTREDANPGDLIRAAAFLGAVAWVRGNGWLWAPVIAMLAWLVPDPSPRRRAPAATYVVLTVSAVIVHAWTAFPYVYDELHRMVSWIGPVTPNRIAVGAFVAAIGWISFDELAFSKGRRSTVARWTLRAGPMVLFFVAAAALAGYFILRPETPTRPFSRLDPAGPLLGTPLVIAAALGALDAATRTRLRGAAGVWALAVATIAVLTLGLYTRRNLPQVGLYYYGRYLAAELLPAACLLGVHALRQFHRWLVRDAQWRSGRGLASGATALVFGATLIWSTAGVLVTDPVARLQEFADSDQLLGGLAARTERDAIIVAGGEGWHAGHTFNQVGGALQAGYGRSVVPYRTAEAAYGTLHELLIGRPAATGQPADPVYLLLNEATHHMRRQPQGRLVAAFDDKLWPPFIATRVTLAEMFVDRLTPGSDAVPTRVTRDELRMALIQVKVDEHHRGVHRFDLRQTNPRLRVEGGAGVVDGARCLSRTTALTIRLDGLPDGPGGLVVVAAPGTARHNSRWTVRVDAETRPLNPPRLASRERDTLGPLVMRAPPRSIEILGSPKAGKHVCRHGALLEVRWLEAPPSFIVDAPLEAITFGPRRDLGHPVRPTGWVPGRGLGRYRTGVEGADGLVGMALRLRADRPLRFADELLPSAEAGLDVVVTVTGTRLREGAELVLVADGVELGRSSPPPRRSGSWQTPPIRWTPPGPVARFSLRLEGAESDDWVLVRDIGLFSRAAPIASTVAVDSQR